MTEPLSADKKRRMEYLQEASRLIVTSREKMPRSARWQLSLRRTLWRYSRELWRQINDPPSEIIQNTEEENCDPHP
ncbi:MAG: hypothetical protein ACOYZ7_11955 [Chloroflexota bacterium]